MNRESLVASGGPLAANCFKKGLPPSSGTNVARRWLSRPGRASC